MTAQGFHSPADNKGIGLIPFGYVNGSRMKYSVQPRHALAFVDWAINYGLNKPFRLEFPNGSRGIWWVPALDLITTSAPDEFSSVVGHWPLPPYPIGCGDGQKRILVMLMYQAGLRFQPIPTEYCVPATLELREMITRFIWHHIDRGKPVAAYYNNGVWWIRS
jgi:hypothetical protein